jgi:hypothetical protein
MSEPTANYEVQQETKREVASRSMMEQLTEEAIQEIEEQEALKRKSAASVFRSMLNQPSLVSISSANANSTRSSEGFSEFTVDLPRPILKVDTVQLLNANIPECTQNIPNTACAFWYYRLNPYLGAVPNPLNLYMVRLLPSYYKPEFGIGTTYGFNQTFFDYQDVETQLAKSVVRDLAADNITTLIALGNDEPTETIYLPEVPYIANDIEITFDEDQNKFQMTGLNAYLPLISFTNEDISTNSFVTQFAVGTTYALGEYVYWEFSGINYLYRSAIPNNVGNYPFFASTVWTLTTGDILYSASTTYALGEFVSYNSFAYRSLQDGNLNHTPDVSPTYWVVVQSDSRWVKTWDNQTFYQVGTIVYNPTTYSFWVCKLANLTNFAPSSGPYWDQYVPPADGIYNRYLVAGYDDPNVAIRQGTQQKTWNPYNTFFYGASMSVRHKDVAYYQAPSQDIGVLVNTIPFQYPLTWSGTNNYVVGDLVLLSSVYYEAIIPSLNKSPPNTVFWKVRTLTYSQLISYVTGDVVVYAGNFYVAVQPSKNQTPPTTVGNVNTFWQKNYWLRDYTNNQAADAGLHTISSKYDMIDQFPVTNFWAYPFPAGIPGQPFNPNPKRLLNSILGFTWNGIMDVSVFDGFELFGRLANNTVIQLYNRVRPVPPYQTAIATENELGASNSVVNTTFTANGYANLVYTSVVAIYGSIAGAKTLDTQRNTSLLGMTSMNADNLGVSFYGNYIDSELLANEEDLYTISIQLYDEFNEPFVLTNNAVVTLTFKMTYKNK